MIPPVAHFVWYGENLPWIYALAVKSAARRGDFVRVVLHHRDNLSNCAAWPELRRLGNFEARPLDESALLEKAWGSELAEVGRKLESFAAKANVVRAAILYLEGGVYLDADTITVQSLTPLREASSAFLGYERRAYPERMSLKNNPLPLMNAWLKDAVRFGFRLLPQGYRLFARLAAWYPLAGNNAVLAAAPGHPFIARLLETMTKIPAAQRHLPRALGPHLLHKVLDDYRGNDFRIYRPEYFYPLPPVISVHWFRCGVGRSLGEVITPETLVVHWYSSLLPKALLWRIDADYVRQHAPRQLFSQLVLPFLDS